MGEHSGAEVWMQAHERGHMPINTDSAHIPAHIQHHPDIVLSPGAGRERTLHSLSAGQDFLMPLASLHFSK